MDLKKSKKKGFGSCDFSVQSLCVPRCVLILLPCPLSPWEAFDLLPFYRIVIVYRFIVIVVEIPNFFRFDMLYPCRYAREKLSVREDDRRCSPLAFCPKRISVGRAHHYRKHMCSIRRFRTKLTFRRNVLNIFLSNDISKVSVRYPTLVKTIQRVVYSQIWGLVAKTMSLGANAETNAYLVRTQKASRGRYPNDSTPFCRGASLLTWVRDHLYINTYYQYSVLYYEVENHDHAGRY